MLLHLGCDRTGYCKISQKRAEKGPGSEKRKGKAGSLEENQDRGPGTISGFKAAGGGRPGYRPGQFEAGGRVENRPCYYGIVI